MKLRNALLIISIFLTSSVFISCQDDKEKRPEADDVQMTEGTDATRSEQIRDQRTNSVRMAVKSKPDLSTFALRMDAVAVADSMEQAEGPFTIFAPNNTAYSYLYREHGENALRDTEMNDEINFLIAKGKFTTDSLRQGIQENKGSFTIPTLQGEHLIVSMKNDSIFLRGRTGSGASIIEPDIEAANGVVHVINTVLLPGDIQTRVELTDQADQ